MKKYILCICAGIVSIVFAVFLSRDLLADALFLLLLVFNALFYTLIRYISEKSIAWCCMAIDALVCIFAAIYLFKIHVLITGVLSLVILLFPFLALWKSEA